MKDTWYVCDPDWEDALGPMSRADLDRLISNRQLAGSCLAWHPDLSEWRPLYGSLGASTSDSRSSSAETAAAAAHAAQAAPKSQEQIAQSSKAQRKAQLQAQQAAQANLRAADSARQQANRQRNTQAATRAAKAKDVEAQAATDKSKEQQANAAFFVQALRRLGARLIDLLLVMPILVAAIFVLLQQQFGLWPDRTVQDLNPNGLVWLGLLLAVPVEALMLATFGATPGKWLFGLSVRTHHGEKPGLALALGRQRSVFLRGLALGIPVLSFISILVAGIQTLNNKSAPWDQIRKLRIVEEGESGGLRPKLAIAGVIAALYFFMNDSVLDVVQELQQMLGTMVPGNAILETP